MIPLYQHEKMPPHPSPKSNFGLWYDKFCNKWEKGKNNMWEFRQKAQWISEAETFHFQATDLLEEYILRRLRMVAALNGRFWVFETETPFVTGMGRAHPVENGIAWDYSLGLPFIPGSSIKGALKASNRQYFDGKFDISESERIHFMDAIPVTSPSLIGDVVTPHYGPYYQGETAPGDWFDPTPIPFLTVKERQRFLFSIVGSCQHHDMIEQWLEATLKWAGVGAKTSSAYGRFIRVKSEEQRLQAKLETFLAKRQQEERVRSLNPVEQEMDADGYHDNAQRFMETMTQKWLPRMEDAATTEGDRLVIAQKLKDWYLIHKSQEWKKPNRKNEQKISRIKKILGEI